MLQQKYQQNPGEGHAGNLFWPGTPEGFPVRMPSGETPPTLRQEEIEKLPLILDFHSELFVLGDPEQKARYDSIMDRIQNGWFRQVRRIDRWSDDPVGPVVWLEWVQIYGEIPNKKHPEMSDETTP